MTFCFAPNMQNMSTYTDIQSEDYQMLIVTHYCEKGCHCDPYKNRTIYKVCRENEHCACVKYPSVCCKTSHSIYIHDSAT